MGSRDSFLNPIIERQYDISTGNLQSIDLPKYQRYTICNLRGGIGKTTLTFNLAHLADEILVVDTCPQGNLSYFFDNNYYQNATVNVYDMILPYIVPGLGKATRVASRISATNSLFNSGAYYISSSEQLYILPAQISTALSQARALQSPQQEKAIESILLSLKSEVDREMAEIGVSKCLIDTSPFFAGATQLSWHATNSLIIPVRTDQQSINSLMLLLKLLSDPASEFRKSLPADYPTPKIQMIILTHGTWSTTRGARKGTQGDGSFVQ